MRRCNRPVPSCTYSNAGMPSIAGAATESPSRWYCSPSGVAIDAQAPPVIQNRFSSRVPRLTSVAPTSQALGLALRTNFGAAPQAGWWPTRRALVQALSAK